MTDVAPIQRLNLIKSFLSVFLISTAAWAVLSVLLLGTLYVGWITFLASVVVALALGWSYYRRRYHAALRYDARGFELRRGSHSNAGTWHEFDTVTLVHLGYGEFAVRLYRKAVIGGENKALNESTGFVDIPVSTLKLDPSEFRFKVIELVKQEANTNER